MSSTVPSVTTASKYVYGITHQDARVSAEMSGVRGHAVHTEPVGSVAALVSDFPDGEDAGLVEDIRAHGAVLDAVAEEFPVLPMTFGTIVPDVSALSEQVTAEAQRAYLKDLGRIAGATQFTLRVRYIRDVVLAELVAQHPEIAQLRAATVTRSEDESYYERIRLGELVVQSLDERRPTDARGILDAVQAIAVEVRTRETGQADDVLEAAVLVHEGETATFEDLVEQLASERAERMRFRLVGPQAPYDFVTEV